MDDEFFPVERGYVISKKKAIIIICSSIFILILTCVITSVSVNTANKKKQKSKNLNECIDGCNVPRYDENGNEVLGVVSPLGYNKVEMMMQEN